MYTRNLQNTNIRCKSCQTIAKKPCENCKKLTKNLKYCSSSCSAQVTGKLYPKRKLTKKCTKCLEKVVKSYKNRLCEDCSIQYENNKSQKYKDRTLEFYYQKESLKNLHKSSKSAHIRALARSWFKHLTLLPCAVCNYTKHVEICHIKPIKTFSETSLLGEVNSPKNIIQLCPNCHWEFDNGYITKKTIKEALKRLELS